MPPLSASVNRLVSQATTCSHNQEQCYEAIRHHIDPARGCEVAGQARAWLGDPGFFQEHAERLRGGVAGRVEEDN
jgi:hypothetical protein